MVIDRIGPTKTWDEIGPSNPERTFNRSFHDRISSQKIAVLGIPSSLMTPRYIPGEFMGIETGNDYEYVAVVNVNNFTISLVI
jgi:hypothetical protein